MVGRGRLTPGGERSKPEPRMPDRSSGDAGASPALSTRRAARLAQPGGNRSGPLEQGADVVAQQIEHSVSTRLVEGAIPSWGAINMPSPVDLAPTLRTLVVKVQFFPESRSRRWLRLQRSERCARCSIQHGSTARIGQQKPVGLITQSARELGAIPSLASVTTQGAARVS